MPRIIRKNPPMSRQAGERCMLRLDFSADDLERVKRAAEDEARSEANLVRWIIHEAIASDALPDEPAAYDRGRLRVPCVHADITPEDMKALATKCSPVGAVCRHVILAWLQERGY